MISKTTYPKIAREFLSLDLVVSVADVIAKRSLREFPLGHPVASTRAQNLSPETHTLRKIKAFLEHDES